MKKELHPTQSPMRTILFRSEDNKIIAGVCGGIGEYFRIDPTIVRIVFIILALFQGLGIVVYFLFWIIIPTESASAKTQEDSIKNNLDEMKVKLSGVAQSIKNENQNDSKRHWWAVLIIVIGFLLLFKNFGVFDAIDFSRFWPVILIVLGLVFLLKR